MHCLLECADLIGAAFVQCSFLNRVHNNNLIFNVCFVSLMIFARENIVKFRQAPYTGFCRIFSPSLILLLQTLGFLCLCAVYFSCLLTRYSLRFTLSLTISLSLAISLFEIQISKWINECLQSREPDIGFVSFNDGLIKFKLFYGQDM